MDGKKLKPKLVYPLCPIHLDESLQLVCLTCTSHSLACPLCIDSGHHLHEVISLKKFLTSEVSKLHQQQPDFQLMQPKLQILFQNSIEFIEKMRKQIGHEINQLENFFVQRAERFQNQLKFICGVHTKESAQRLSDSVEAAKIKIHKGAKIPRNEQLEDKIFLNISLMEQAFSDACVEIRRIIFSLKDFSAASSDLFLNSKSLNNKHFDEKNMHKGMEVSNENTRITNKEYDNSYHSCVALPALSPFRSYIVYKIGKTEHKCIWLGVTDIQSVKKSKFTNLYKSGGKHYMIWQAGGEGEAEFYAQDFQDRPMIGWNFEEGDEITVRVKTESNNENKFVQFVKNEGKRDSQPCKFISKISKQVGLYYACVGLGDIGESIEILNII